MPNRNNSSNRNGEDAGQSSDEAGQNSTTINSINIVIVVVLFPPAEQPTPLSEQVIDERTVDPQDLTNQHIDQAIEYEPDHLETTILMAYWFIFMLFSFIIYYCWPLLIFAFIAYQLLTYNNQPGVNSRESQLRHSNSPLHYRFNWDRDAEAEHRTAHPTDEDIQFANTVEIFAPHGIEATQAHELVGLNNIQHANITTNNENGNINDDEIIAPNIQNEANVQVMTHEDNTSQAVVDDPTYNINPLGSIESQDDIQSNDSSDEEDRIISSESGFDGDDEDDSADDNEQTGRTSLITANPSNSIQSNPPLNPENAVAEQTITISAIGLPNEPVEIEANAATPGEGPCQIIRPRIRPSVLLIPKTSNPLHLNDQSSDESIS